MIDWPTSKSCHWLWLPRVDKNAEKTLERENILYLPPTVSKFIHYSSQNSCKK